MKLLITILNVFIINLAFCQEYELLDLRDSTSYKTININGTLWMLDNLSYVTELSRTPNDSVRRVHNLENVSGRYYHFQELDSVCPRGWKLATYQNWIDYFLYFGSLKNIEMKALTIDIEEDPFHRVIEHEDGINFFEQGNPLNLQAVSRFQGENVSSSPTYPFGDYWVIDPEAEFTGMTHIHIINDWDVIPIHSHEHHMNPEKPEEIRRFMCRCVKEK
ncbi:MAG: FISUMP domain-containing protein [Bacteroidota bacterium]